MLRMHPGTPVLVVSLEHRDMSVGVYYHLAAGEAALQVVAAGVRCQVQVVGHRTHPRHLCQL